MSKLADELERLVTDYQWPKSRATIARAVAALRAIEALGCDCPEYRHALGFDCPSRIAAEGVEVKT